MTDVVSTFRKGIKEALENFGEVSIISVLEKILEQIIMCSVYKHLENKKVIRNRHHGFVNKS